MLIPNPIGTRLAHPKTLFLPANLSNSEFLTPKVSEFQLSERYAGKTLKGRCGKCNGNDANKSFRSWACQSTSLLIALIPHREVGWHNEERVIRDFAAGTEVEGLLTHKYVYIFDKMMSCHEPVGAKGFLQFSVSPS
jgi:hypothetical protein